MKITSCLTIAVLGFVLGQSKLVPPAFSKEQPPIDTAKIEAATGLKGTFNKDENVFKVTKPRTDMKIRVDEWQMPPFMGLTSWAAFTPAMTEQTMVMGDTVLFEDEVNPAMSAAFEAGLEVTALHNHFFFDEPKVYFMHIGGMGDAGSARRRREEGLRQDRRDTRGATRRRRRRSPVQRSAPRARSRRNRSRRSSARRASRRTACSRSSSAAQPTMHGVPSRQGDGRQHLGGVRRHRRGGRGRRRFRDAEGELQTVLKAHAQGRHQHRRDPPAHEREEPRILFLHYWGKGKAASLAQSLDTVLKAQAAVARIKSPT